MTHNDLHYEFGPYQPDPSKRILTRNGEGIPLTPKATEILLVLVKPAGQLVEKDELLKEVRRGTFVEEANLVQNIIPPASALGDDRTGPKYIETVARRGYRFIRSVHRIDVNQEESGDVAESDNHAGKRRVVVVLPFNNNTGNVEKARKHVRKELRANAVLVANINETLARLCLETQTIALAEGAGAHC